MKIINVLFALIIAVGLFLPFNQPVQAATVTLAPDGEGALTQGTYPAGVGNWHDVLTNDGDTSYLYMWNGGAAFDYYHTYTFAASGITGANINSVTVYALARATGYDGENYLGCRIAGTNYGFDTKAVIGGSYTSISRTWTTNPATSAAWTVAQVDAAEFGIRHRMYATGWVCTQIYVVVDYSSITVPTVSTSATSSIASTSATLNGNISSSGGATITNYGFVWDTVSRADPGNTAPAASAYAGNWSIGAGTYSTGLISRATGNVLVKGTLYYCRAAAYNSIGWSYGSEVTFTTLSPTVTTQAASAIAPTTATGNGNITSNGGEVITEKGICYKAGVAGDPTTADSTSHDHVDSIGAYTEAIAGLTKGTAYRLRAYIISASGTAYGTTVDLVTIDDPTISTSAASLVSSTTARLNSQVTFDGAVGGGEACTVTFVYKAGSPFANYAAILAAGGTEVVAAGTYTVGQFPNYDVVGLTAGTLYSFAVKIVNSTTTVAYGSVLTFTTSTGISNTTALTAIPTSTTVSLAWVKGTGAGFTLVRYSASAYPATTADGTLAYLGIGNSYMLTGLTPGTSYYFSAWGKTGALYSAGYVTAMATTLAFDTAVSTGTIEAPPSNSWWNQTPSTTKVSNIPLVSGLVSANAAAYSIPESSLWYFLWVLFSVGIGVFIYSKSGNNLPMSLGAQALLFALGAVLGLVMLWIMVLFMIIGAGFSLWGDRR